MSDCRTGRLEGKQAELIPCRRIGRPEEVAMTKIIKATDKELFIEGLCPIAAMPFMDSGKVDLDSFVGLLDFLKGGEYKNWSITGLVLFGIASEFYKITDAEKDRLAAIFINRLTDSSIKSIISVTEHSTELAMERARFYELLGADGLMLLPPYFLSPSKEAILYHLRYVSNSVSLPVMFQYAPAETGFKLDSSEFAELVNELPQLLFKIESNPPMNDMEQLLKIDPNITILNGYAGLYMLKTLELGARGVMPGCSFPEIYAAILNYYRNNEKTKAAELHAWLKVYLDKWMSDCEFIIAVEKRILQKRGLIRTAYCRKPAYALTPEDEKEVEQFTDGILKQCLEAAD